LHSNMFSNLKKLKTLNLDYNPIKVIKRDAFNGLEKLEELSLCGNILEEIDAGLFDNLKSLKSLLLHGNKVQQFIKKFPCLLALKNFSICSTTPGD